MKRIDSSAPSQLLDYLPSIYQDDQEFLSAYLSAFERILLGRHDGTTIELRSLEETIDFIPQLFEPAQTPKDFLPWLAGWAAFTLRADLDEGKQRGFIARIIQLYRRRGTKENLIDLLQIFTGTTPEIDENAKPSADFKKLFPQFNTDTDTRPLHFFKVSVVLPPDEKTVRRKTEIARALIELEKPAHTFYELETTFASMRIAKDYSDKDKLFKGTLQYRASLEKDTLINSWNKEMDDQLKKEKDDAGTPST